MNGGEQMGRMGVPQRIDRGALADPTCRHRLGQHLLHHADTDRALVLERRLLDHPLRKHLDRMAMSPPERAQDLQLFSRQRHIAIAPAFALVNVQETPGAIDVADLPVNAFAQPRPTHILGSCRNRVPSRLPHPLAPAKAMAW